MCIIIFPVIHIKVMHLTSQNEWPTKSLSVQMVILVRHCSLTTENNSCEDSNMKLLIIQACTFQFASESVKLLTHWRRCKASSSNYLVF